MIVVKSVISLLLFARVKNKSLLSLTCSVIFGHYKVLGGINCRLNVLISNMLLLGSLGPRLAIYQIILNHIRSSFISNNYHIYSSLSI